MVREAFGPRWAIVAYVMPGFALAKLAAEVYERDPSVEGLVLVNHGLSPSPTTRAPPTSG